MVAERTNLVMKRWLPIYLRGCLMGMVELIPGISGGTIAFVTGIYERLISALAVINPALLVRFLCKPRGTDTRGLSAMRADFEFLAVLFAGMATSVFLFARLIRYMMTTHAILLWAFFLGLILGSLWVFTKRIASFRIQDTPVLVIGVLGGLFLSMAPPIDIGLGALSLILAGAVAVCAWILPGISGSHMLLILGMYPLVVSAVADMEVFRLGLLLIGAGIGLMLFTTGLRRLFHAYGRLVLVFLTAFILGTLPRIWPWREIVSYQFIDNQEPLPLQTRPLLPSSYQQFTGDDPQMAAALFLILVGLLTAGLGGWKWTRARFAG